MVHSIRYGAACERSHATALRPRVAGALICGGLTKPDPKGLNATWRVRGRCKEPGSPVEGGRNGRPYDNLNVE